MDKDKLQDTINHLANDSSDFTNILECLASIAHEQENRHERQRIPGKDSWRVINQELSRIADSIRRPVLLEFLPK